MARKTKDIAGEINKIFGKGAADRLAKGAEEASSSVKEWRKEAEKLERSYRGISTTQEKVNLLSKVALEKYAKEMNKLSLGRNKLLTGQEKEVKKIQKELEKELKTAEKLEKQEKEYIKLKEKTLGLFEKINKLATRFTDILVGGASAAIGGIVSLFKSAYDQWQRLHEQISLGVRRTKESLRDIVGNVPALEKGLGAASRKAYWLGFNMESVATTMAGMTQTGGARFMEGAQKGEAPGMGRAGMFLARGMGMGEETAGKFMGKVKRFTDVTEKEFTSFGLRMSKLAKEFNVSEFIAPKEIASNMNLWLKFGKDWGRVAETSTIYTAQFGVELEKVAAVGERFKTFREAAVNVGKINAVFGTQLDTMTMLNKLNPVEQAEELRKALLRQGYSWEQMTFRERQALEGMTGWDQETISAILTSKNAKIAFEDVAKARAKEAKEVQNETKNRREAFGMIGKVRKQLEWLWGISGKINKLYLKMSASFKGAFNAYWAGLMKIIDAFGKLFGSAGKSTDQKLTEIIDKMSDFVVTIIDKYGPKLIDLFDKAATWLAGEGMKKLPWLLEKIEGFLGKIFNSLGLLFKGEYWKAFKALPTSIQVLLGVLTGIKMVSAISNVAKLGSSIKNLAGLGGGGGMMGKAGGALFAGAGGGLALGAGGMLAGLELMPKLIYGEQGLVSEAYQAATKTGPMWGKGVELDASSEKSKKKAYELAVKKTGGSKGFYDEMITKTKAGEGDEARQMAKLIGKRIKEAGGTEFLLKEDDLRKQMEQEKKMQPMLITKMRHDAVLAKEMNKAMSGVDIKGMDTSKIKKLSNVSSAINMFASSMKDTISSVKGTDLSGHTVTWGVGGKAITKVTGPTIDKVGMITALSMEMNTAMGKTIANYDKSALSVAGIDKLTRTTKKQTKFFDEMNKMIKKIGEINKSDLQSVIPTSATLIQNAEVLTEMFNAINTTNTKDKVGYMRVGDIHITIAPIMMEGQAVGNAIVSAMQKKAG